MKKWSYTLGNCCVGKNLSCQRSHPEASRTKDCWDPGSTPCSCAPRAPHTRPQRMENVTGYTVGEPRGQWTIKNQGSVWELGGRGLSPQGEPTISEMMTMLLLRMNGQDQNDVKTRPLWEMNTTSIPVRKTKEKQNSSLGEFRKYLEQRIVL